MVQTVFVSQQVNAGMGQHYRDAKLRGMSRYNAVIIPTLYVETTSDIFDSWDMPHNCYTSLLWELQKETVFFLPCVYALAEPIGLCYKL
jgi:hypothetical protein